MDPIYDIPYLGITYTLGKDFTWWPASTSTPCWTWVSGCLKRLFWATSPRQPQSHWKTNGCGGKGASWLSCQTLSFTTYVIWSMFLKYSKTPAYTSQKFNYNHLNHHLSNCVSSSLFRHFHGSVLWAFLEYNAIFPGFWYRKKRSQCASVWKKSKPWDAKTLLSAFIVSYSLVTCHVVTVVEYWNSSSQKWPSRAKTKTSDNSSIWIWFLRYWNFASVSLYCRCGQSQKAQQNFGLSFSICAQEASKSSNKKPIWPKPCGWALPWLVFRKSFKPNLVT